jgi:hypothetical protein
MQVPFRRVSPLIADLVERPFADLSSCYGGLPPLLLWKSKDHAFMSVAHLVCLWSSGIVWRAFQRERERERELGIPVASCATPNLNDLPNREE